jgi:hypothetical protein
MPDLELPEEHVQGIRVLSKMDAAAFERAIGAIAQVKAFSDRKRLVKNIAEAMPEIERKDATKIIDTAIAMLSFCSYVEISISTFVDDVFSSSSVVDALDPDKTSVAKDRLAKLLKAKNIVVAAKAAAILTAHEHPFRSARIFTDIRTVFTGDDNDDELSPAAAVIVQMMRVRYIKNGNQEEIFFALDSADIDSMIETLERAKTKCENLKPFIDKASIPYVEVQNKEEQE